jgi:hypothetical protein
MAAEANAHACHHRSGRWGVKVHLRRGCDMLSQWRQTPVIRLTVPAAAKI